MILIGVGIIAAGALALAAFLVFSVRSGPGPGSAGAGITVVNPGVKSGVERQRAIEEAIRATQMPPPVQPAPDGSKTPDPSAAAGHETDKPLATDQAPPPVAGDQHQDGNVCTILDATDTDAIKSRVGKTATVAGRVLSCSWSSSGKVLFVNFSIGRGAFYAVMFKNREKDFTETFGTPPEKHFAGRDVEITGAVEIYEGRPQIKIEKPGQVRFRD